MVPITSSETVPMSRQEMDRTYNRWEIEINLIMLLTNVLSPPKYISRDYAQTTLMDNLKVMTNIWQQGTMSGTQGEVFSQWQARGFLRDFPEFRKRKPSDEIGNSLSIEKLGGDGSGGKHSITATFSVEGSEDKDLAEYRFMVSIDELHQRRKQIAEEARDFRTKHDSKI